MDNLLESQLAEGISWGFTTLISGLAFVLWHKFKRLQDDVEKNKEEIANFKTHVAENYSQKKDIYDMEARINEQLSHLGHRLDKGFNMIYEQLLKDK